MTAKELAREFGKRNGWTPGCASEQDLERLIITERGAATLRRTPGLGAPLATPWITPNMGFVGMENNPA